MGIALAALYIVVGLLVWELRDYSHVRDDAINAVHGPGGYAEHQEAPDE